MSIEELDQIDAVVIDSDKALCALVIVDHLPWDEPHLIIMQAKINHYLQWIESGEVYLHYPQAAGCEFCIQVTAIFAPNAQANIFLSQAKEVLDASGFHLNVMPLASNYAEILE